MATSNESATATATATATADQGAPPRAGVGIGSGFADDYRPPSAVRAIALAAAAGVLATSAVGVYRGALGSEHAAWFVIAFEAVAILSAVFALMVGLGRFASAAGMTLLCCAGAVGAGAFLEQLAGAQVLPKWFVVARGGLTVMMLGAAAWAVLARNPGAAAKSLTKAALFGAPLVAILVGAWLTRRHLGGLPDVLKLLGGIAMFLVVTGLTAGTVHCAIRAFEKCDEDPALR